MNREECPIWRDVLNTGDELRRLSRRLRRTLNVCQACLERDECGLIGELRRSLGQAARETLAELIQEGRDLP